MKVEVGDYIVGDSIFIVVAENVGVIHKSYDLKCLTTTSGTITYYEPILGIETSYKISNEIKSATRGHLRHLVKLIKKEDAKTLKILFG